MHCMLGFLLSGGLPVLRVNTQEAQCFKRLLIALAQGHHIEQCFILYVAHAYCAGRCACTVAIRPSDLGACHGHAVLMALPSAGLYCKQNLHNRLLMKRLQHLAFFLVICNLSYSEDSGKEHASETA